MIFKFKVLSLDNEEFIRDYELRHDATLLDFHQLICEDLNFDSEEMASFFSSDKAWNKLREYTLLDMSIDEDEVDEASPVLMVDTTLDELMQSKHERLLYSYDLLNDRSLFIELIESHTGKKSADYPCVSFSAGDAPTQVIEAEGAIFSEMMGDFGDDFDESYNDDEFGDGYDEDYGSDEYGDDNYKDEYY